MEIAGYIAAILIGLSLGLIGGGGSVLTVPVFVYMLHINPVLATTYSLFVVGSCSLVGGARAWHKGLIDFPTVIYFGVSSLVTVFLVRHFVVPAIPDHLFTIGEIDMTKGVFLMVLFALLMVGAAISMIRSRNGLHKATEENSSRIMALIMQGLIVGAITGLLGAGGQLILFKALIDGPAYIVFPFIALFPLFTILLSVLFLRETCSRRQWTGIAIALVAAACLSYQPPRGGQAQGYGWLVLTMLVFIMWGLQAYVMKFANGSMKVESIFFYMALSAVALIPVAIGMTDFSRPVNWGLKGLYLAIPIHLLNAVGALTLVYALRYGKAIIVVPLTSLSSVITVILSLVIYSVMPGTVLTAGLLLASVAIVMLSE